MFLINTVTNFKMIIIFSTSTSRNLYFYLVGPKTELIVRFQHNSFADCVGNCHIAESFDKIGIFMFTDLNISLKNGMKYTSYFFKVKR